MDFQLHRSPCEVCQHGFPGNGLCVCECKEARCLLHVMNLENDLRIDSFTDAVNMIEKSSNHEDTCDRVIMYILHYHRKHMMEGDCSLGFPHDSLYLAIKLMLRYRFRRRNTILIVLDDIFYCEESFDRLIRGAIYGPSVFIDGWRNVFDSRIQCVQALKFCLHHSINGGKAYRVDDTPYIMPDLPLMDGQTPLELATRECRGVGGKIVLNLLLKYIVLANKKALELMKLAETDSFDLEVTASKAPMTDPKEPASSKDFAEVELPTVRHDQKKEKPEGSSSRKSKRKGTEPVSNVSMILSKVPRRDSINGAVVIPEETNPLELLYHLLRD